MLLRLGRWFELECGAGGLFLKLPGMGQVWVDRDGWVWDR